MTRRFPLIAGTPLELHRFKTGAALHADRGNQTRCALSNHSLTARTTLEVGRALTVLPPNSFMIGSSYSGNVFTGSFAVTYLVAFGLELSQKLRQRQCGAITNCLPISDDGDGQA
jgi:hypothetical protein